MLIKPLYSADILQRIAQLESICGQDVGRGIELLVKAARGGLLGSARAIAEHPSLHVAIITGFFLPGANPPAAETDGPVGCATLAAGLIRAGVNVRIVTDSLCLNAVKVAVEAAGVSLSVSFDIVPVNAENQDESILSILNFWESLKTPISHVISIERAGPSYDGIIRNIRGEDITAYTPNLHLLFNSPKIISVGIGDGGNELGMGNISPELISQNIRYGDKIACVTKSDYLIVCGVSNWGGTALLMAISLLRPDWQKAIMANLNIENELQILQAIVKDGPAVDGITGEQSLSVDNLAWEFHADVLQKFMHISRSQLDISRI